VKPAFGVMEPLRTRSPNPKGKNVNKTAAPFGTKGVVRTASNKGQSWWRHRAWKGTRKEGGAAASAWHEEAAGAEPTKVQAVVPLQSPRYAKRGRRSERVSIITFTGRNGLWKKKSTRAVKLVVERLSRKMSEKKKGKGKTLIVRKPSFTRGCGTLVGAVWTKVGLRIDRGGGWVVGQGLLKERNERLRGQESVRKLGSAGHKESTVAQGDWGSAWKKLRRL